MNRAGRGHSGDTPGDAPRAGSAAGNRSAPRRVSTHPGEPHVGPDLRPCDNLGDSRFRHAVTGLCIGVVAELATLTTNKEWREPRRSLR